MIDYKKKIEKKQQQLKAARAKVKTIEQEIESLIQLDQTNCNHEWHFIVCNDTHKGNNGSFHVCRKCGLAERVDNNIFFRYANIPALEYRTSTYVVGKIRTGQELLDYYLTSPKVNVDFLRLTIDLLSEQKGHEKTCEALENKIQEVNQNS